MIGFLRRVARDNTTVLLLVLLMLFGAFVAWQLARLAAEGDDAPVTALATPGASVAEVVATLAEAPVSRPRLSTQRWTTATGARIVFVPAPEIPMLDIRILFDAGGARDGAKPGLARFTSSMLAEGTRTRSADEIARSFESLGVRYGASSFRDMALVELRTLVEPDVLDAAIPLLADVIARPAFNEAATTRTRDRMLVDLQRDEERPGTIASRSFMAALYLVHPYATPADGTVDSVRRIDSNDLRAFHERHYVARNAVIAMTGAIDRARATEIANALTDALPAGAPAPELPAPPGPVTNSFHVRYDSQQTHVYIGLPALQRGDPDEATLLLANQVLGGDGLTAMLAEAVRNERGLAYSVGSSFQAMRSSGPFVINLQTRNEAAGEAIAVTLDTLRRFAKEGPDAQRLEDARRQITGSYPLQFASNGDVVATIAMMGFYGLPDDHFEQQLARIEKATAEDVRAAFNRHVPLDRLITVTLGPDKPSVPDKLPPARSGAAQAQPDPAP